VRDKIGCKKGVLGAGRKILDFLAKDKNERYKIFSKYYVIVFQYNRMREAVSDGRMISISVVIMLFLQP
jgi:hypothetical protein